MTVRPGSAPRRPRVVLLVGEPGSGKTSLGLRLAEALHVPFLARDQVRGGLWLTRGAWADRPDEPPTTDEAVEAFLVTVETMAGLGISLVAEYVVRASRPPDLARLRRAAACVVIQTTAADAPTRRAERDRGSLLLGRPSVLAALGHRDVDEAEAARAARMASVTADMQTAFDLPLLRVDATAGLDPPLDSIIQFVIRWSAAPPPPGRGPDWWRPAARPLR